MSDVVAKIVPGKGQHYSLCILDFNIDIESGVCAVTLDKDGKADRDKACAYCYSSYLYKKDPNAYKPKVIKESEFKKISAKYPAHLLRIGKNFECGHKRTREQLYQILEYCVKYNMHPIVTSKILEYDKRISDLLKASRGVCHISLGRDVDETGAVSQGATNRWRLAQAIKYKRSGCRTQCRIVADVTMPMTDFHRKAVNLMGGSSGILQTPLHYTSRSHFESMRQDVTWDEAKTQKLFSYEHGDLRPMLRHPDWNITKERCGVVGGKEGCNNCTIKINFNKKSYKALLVKLGWNAS